LPGECPQDGNICSPDLLCEADDGLDNVFEDIEELARHWDFQSCFFALIISAIMKNTDGSTLDTVIIHGVRNPEYMRQPAYNCWTILV